MMGHSNTVVDQFCKIRENKHWHAQMSGDLLTNLPGTDLVRTSRAPHVEVSLSPSS